MNDRHQTHAKPAADPEKGVTPLTQQQKDKIKKQDLLHQHKVDAHESHIRAEAELLDIQKQVRDLSSSSDMRPEGTLGDVTMPSAKKFDRTVDPPEPSSHIQFGCVVCGG